MRLYGWSLLVSLLHSSRFFSLRFPVGCMLYAEPDMLSSLFHYLNGTFMCKCTTKWTVNNGHNDSIRFVCLSSNTKHLQSIYSGTSDTEHFEIIIVTNWMMLFQLWDEYKNSSFAHQNKNINIKWINRNPYSAMMPMMAIKLLLL